MLWYLTNICSAEYSKSQGVVFACSENFMQLLLILASLFSNGIECLPCEHILSAILLWLCCATYAGIISKWPGTDSRFAVGLLVDQ